MNKINLIISQKVLIFFSFFLSISFIQNCSNDERLEGYRVSVLESQASFEKNKESNKLILGKPKNIISWTSGGSRSSHDLGNIAFSDNKKFVSHLTKKIGPKGSYSEPVIKNNEIFIMTPNGFIVVYNDKGEFLWELSILPEKTVLSTEIYGGLSLYKNYVAVASSLGEILLINTSERRIAWRYDFKRPFRSAPIFHKGYIFAVTGDDIAVSIDLRGKLRWTKKGPQKNTKIFATVSPAASGNRVFFPFSGGSLVTLNAINGIELWKVNLEISQVGSASSSLGDFVSDPAVFGSTIYAVGAFGESFAVSTNGNVLWRNNIQSTGRLIVSGNAIFFPAKNSAIGRLNSKNGKIVFVKNYPGKKGVSYSNPLLLQNKLLVLASDKTAYWLSPIDGNMIGKEKLGTMISSPPIVANKKLIFISEDGILNILK